MPPSAGPGAVTLGHSPVVDRQRVVVATRLTVFPERPGAACDADALLAAIDAVWPPAEAASQRARPALKPVLLNLADESLLAAVLAAPPRPQAMVEVPAFLAAEPRLAARLCAHAAGGGTLVVKGRPLAALPQAVAAAFAFAIVDADSDAAAVPGVPVLRAGVRTIAGHGAALQSGAAATLGWPIHDPVAPARHRQGASPDIQVVMALIDGVEREEPVARLEAVLRRDPTLAFRLMRYLNSPAFGLSVEISSFGHALMLLGYQRLKRWLALLLASASKAAAARPLLHAAVRRGLLMEELARGAGGDSEMRGEMFICGVFSLLDRLLQQHCAELLRSVPVPERVRSALLGEGGPLQPWLELVRAVEDESLLDIRENAERLLLAPSEVGRAVLAALAAARALD